MSSSKLRRGDRSPSSPPDIASWDGSTSHDSYGTSQRTLADVRDQVAQALAVRAISKAEIIDGVKVGVATPMSQSNEEEYVRRSGSCIKRVLLLQQYLFAIAATESLLICGSSGVFVQRAVVLVRAKFMGRIRASSDEGERWFAVVTDLGAYSSDKLALWDSVRKAAKMQLAPLSPPPGSRGVERMLSDARARLERLLPAQALMEQRDTSHPLPVFLVDIRPASERAADGAIDGAVVIERNVLEWRLDPRCEARLAIADRYDLRVIIFCRNGDASSLAAFALHELGLLNATDIVGGYIAWKDAGLPVLAGHAAACQREGGSLQSPRMEASS